MCVEFGEVTVIIGLVINFLAFRLTIVRISWHLNLWKYSSAVHYGLSMEFKEVKNYKK